MVGCIGLVEEISEAGNNNLSLLTVLANLAKVFNIINHRILLRKMSNLGFCGKLLALLESYLANREQAVNLN